MFRPLGSRHSVVPRLDIRMKSAVLCRYDDLCSCDVHPPIAATLVLAEQVAKLVAMMSNVNTAVANIEAGAEEECGKRYGFGGNPKEIPITLNVKINAEVNQPD